MLAIRGADGFRAGRYTMRREDDEHRPPIPPSQPDAPGGLPPSRPADQEHLNALRKARQARVAKSLVILGIVVILMIFIIANAKAVPVNFVFFDKQPPLIWVMFSCAVLGGIAGYLIGKPGRQIRMHRKPEEPKKPR
jgi:uncharacterized integral membrane protein